MPAPAPARSRARRVTPFFGSGGVGLVWTTAAVVGVLMAALTLWQVLKPRPYYTGSSAVGNHGIAVTVPRGQTMCSTGLHIPAGTGAVQMLAYITQANTRARVTVSLPALGQAASAVQTVNGAAGTPIPFEQPLLGATKAGAAASVCVTALSAPISFSGMPALQLGGPPPLTVGRASIPSSLEVFYLPPGRAERSLLSQAGTIFSRAALFRPGIVGAWTYPVLLFVVLPLSWLLGIFLLARAAGGAEVRVRRRRIRPAAAIALIAFLNAGSWALITPPFQTPDEPDHFAYAQYVAETGHAPSTAPSSRPPFSSSQALGLEGAHSYGVIGSTDGLPPWEPLYQARWERASSTGSHPQDNGGGFTLGAAGHAPPYYLTAAAAYQLVKGASTYSQLTVVRLVSALFAAIVAACAFGIMRELLPRWPTAAVGAGLLVSFQPMFSFIGGAANNDNGVNATAAVALYLLIRALRRGLTWRTGLGLGLALALTPLMKETGYELYPVAVVGVLAILWRYRRSFRWQPWAVLLGSFIFVQGGYRILRPVFYPVEKGVAGSGGAGAISAASAVSTAEHMPLRFLEYLWQLFLPPIAFMGRLFPPGWPFFQVYIERGWGAFGWYSILFPRWVFVVILAVMVLVAVLGLAGAWKWRDRLASRGWEILLLILVPICVLVAVEAAFFAPNGGRTVVAEQGRYIFPAIGALAALAVLGTFGLGKRWHIPLVTTLVVAMIGLCYAGQLMTLGGFYT
jgi:hypothetical protein